MPPPPALSPVAPSPNPPRILDGPLDPEPTDESTEPSDSLQKPSPNLAPKEPTRDSSPSSAAVGPASDSPSRSSEGSRSLPFVPQVPVPPTLDPAPTPTYTKKQNMSSTDPKQQFGGWAIWSRRPTDPSLAPGIIISPRSRPPQDVLEKALRVSTPPESPKPAVAALLATPPSAVAVAPSDLSSTQATPDEPQKLASDPAESPRNDLPETVSSTETEVSTASNTPPVPTSPLSSSTSVSATHSQVKSRSESRERVANVVAFIVAQESPPTEVPEPPSVVPTSSPDTTVLTPPDAVSSSSAPAPTPPLASTSAPSPASAPPVLKKSWASLLRPSAGDAGSASKSSLPTSSVVGFSIPASPPPSHVPPVRRAELTALLNGSPPSRPTSNAFLPRLRPRGLVNSGNMCFANAVLQLLVYCPPFWKLFRELGRLTGPRERGERIGGNATLLVDATVRFLEEFVYEEKKPPLAQQPQQHAGNGKAKEEEDEKKEDDGVDSFLPTYVYDAMKEKKRFDNMRVRSLVHVAPFCY